MICKISELMDNPFWEKSKVMYKVEIERKTIAPLIVATIFASQSAQALSSDQIS